MRACMCSHRVDYVLSRAPRVPIHHAVLDRRGLQILERKPADVPSWLKKHARLDFFFQTPRAASRVHINMSRLHALLFRVLVAHEGQR